MSRNLMGLFQRPFMDRDGALPLFSISLSFIPFPMAHFMDLSPLSLLSKSIDRGDEMRLSALPAHFHDKEQRRARGANDGQHSRLCPDEVESFLDRETPV